MCHIAQSQSAFPEISRSLFPQQYKPAPFPTPTYRPGPNDDGAVRALAYSVRRQRATKTSTRHSRQFAEIHI